MLPTLSPGQIIIATGLFKGLRADDVVIVRHYGLDKVKRIQYVGNGRIFIMGDNLRESTDSRTFGWLTDDKVLAKVLWPRKLSKPLRES